MQAPCFVGLVSAQSFTEVELVEDEDSFASRLRGFLFSLHSRS